MKLTILPGKVFYVSIYSPEQNCLDSRNLINDVSVSVTGVYLIRHLDGDVRGVARGGAGGARAPPGILQIS